MLTTAILPPALARIVAAAALVLAATSACAQDRVLLERHSALNTIIVGETDSGLRVLRFGHGGARQSVVKIGDPKYLDLPYARIAPVALAFVPDPQGILIVGLGGGTLPMFLRQHLPRTRIDAVELDPEVVAVAKSHFGFREDESLHAHVGDGRRFIEQSKRQYDLIILDAFGVDATPYALVTREFLLAVRNVLSPRGVVMSNVWSRESNRLYESMIRTIVDVFGGATIIDVPGAGNRLVFGYLWSPRLSRDTLVDRAQSLGARLKLRNDLASAVRSGYRDAALDAIGGMILLDAFEPR